MAGIEIAAFADEADSALSGQIAALHENGIRLLEIRGVDGKNVSALTAAEAREVKKRLDDGGIAVWSVGSPFGKISITDPFEPHLEQFRRALENTRLLGASRLRLFSFYIPKGDDPAQYRDEVLSRMNAFVEAAQGSGVTLLHENEKGIYGDTAERCYDLLVESDGGMKAIFDPANFIQSGQDIPEAWAMLGARTTYLHIKDAMPDGRVVPAGKGIGHLPEILRDFAARGGESVTVEPHLQVFDGLAALEKDQKSAIPEGMYATSDDAFDAACGALKDILKTMED